MRSDAVLELCASIERFVLTSGSMQVGFGDSRTLKDSDGRREVVDTPGGLESGGDDGG